MKHTMKLYKEPFEKIAAGKKTVEMRLNDEKRQKLSLGDEIDFSNENGEIIKTKVKALRAYSGFFELYSNEDLKKCGYAANEKADPADMEKYYSKEKQEKYGALAIELEVLSVRRARS